MISQAQLRNMFVRLDTLRVGVIGDFCLDMYWQADMTQSQLSRETPHFPLPIVSERFAAGGAGNVACNVAALQPECVHALGVTGADWRGTLLRQALCEQGVDTSTLVTDPERVTNAYIKPLRMGISQTVYEDPRIDFEARMPLGVDAETALIATLDALSPTLDVLCVCDQMQFGCITPAVREHIMRLARNGLLVIVDSRDRISLYHDVIVKPNEVEAARALPGVDAGDFAQLTRLLSEKTGCPAVVTAGAQGCYVCQDGEVCHIPGRNVPPPIDICGAGDTFLAGFGCALGSGVTLGDAAAFGCLASAITIRKLQTTGTATREELLREVEKP